VLVSDKDYYYKVFVCKYCCFTVYSDIVDV